MRVASPERAGTNTSVLCPAPRIHELESSLVVSCPPFERISTRAPKVRGHDLRLVVGSPRCPSSLREGARTPPPSVPLAGPATLVTAHRLAPLGDRAADAVYAGNLVAPDDGRPIFAGAGRDVALVPRRDALPPRLSARRRRRIALGSDLVALDRGLERQIVEVTGELARLFSRDACLHSRAHRRPASALPRRTAVRRVHLARRIGNERRSSVGRIAAGRRAVDRGVSLFGSGRRAAREGSDWNRDGEERAEHVTVERGAHGGRFMRTGCTRPATRWEIGGS